MPLRGAKTQPGFHPFAKPSRFWPGISGGQTEHPLMAECPAGGENPQGFHPFVKHIPALAERAAAWQAEHPLTADCPAGGENP
ncbi:MAG: hypothetical protein LBK61_04340 [Spirochaetaceae bacterium]|nr:hypothetical protein [Spirochaetaceae bacterium]